MTHRCAIYCRVSTTDQKDRGTSLDTQAEGCRRYAEAKGWGLVGEFQDDLSGTTPMLDRPGLRAAYETCADGRASVLVVYDVDRLAREGFVGAFIRHAFAEAGATIDFVRGGSTATPEDGMLVGMKSLFAEFERLQILERTRRGKLAHSRNGAVIAGRPPYGYDLTEALHPGEGRLMINKAEAQVVHDVFELYGRQGLSLHEVAHELNQHDVPSRGGRPWGRTSVRRVLTHTAYTGRWAFNRRRRTKQGVKVRPESDWVWVDVPRILDDGLWRAAQDRIAENRASRRRPSHRPTPLHGLVFCAKCGRRMARQYRAKYEYWRCNGRCGAPSFPGKPLEVEVVAWVVRLAASRKEFEAALARANARSAPLLNRLHSAEATVAKLEGSLERAHEVYVSGGWSKERYDGEVQKVKAKLGNARAEVGRLRGDLGQQGTLDPEAAQVEWDQVFDELRRLAPKLGKLDPRVDAGIRATLASLYRRLDLQVTLSLHGDTKVAAVTCRLGVGSLSFITY